MNRLKILLLLLTLSACTKPYLVSSVNNRQYTFSDTTFAGVDPETERVIFPFKDSLDKIMNKPVGYSADQLTAIELSNFAADACMMSAVAKPRDANQPKIDFVVLNRGGLRTALPKGIILLRNVYELMPFENSLVILKLDGRTVAKLVGHLASHPMHPVSGIRIRTNQNMEPVSVTIRGVAFDEAKTYNVATSDFLAKGNDGFDFSNPLAYYTQGSTIRDLMVNYLLLKSQQSDTIKADYEQRITR